MTDDRKYEALIDPNADHRVFTVYVTTENSDLTEGKGRQQPVSYWLTPEAAVKDANARGVKMGDGEAEEWRFDRAGTSDKVKLSKNKLYGFHKSAVTNEWRTGYVDGRDLPHNDPEWGKYLELKARFENQG